MKRACIGAIVVLLMLAAPGLMPAAEAKIPEPRSVFNLTRYDSGLPQMTVGLEPGASNDSATITLPANAQVVNASMELSSLPYTDGGIDYPVDPRMDVGADGDIEWAFGGFAYGAMGYQRQFNDGFTTSPAYNLSLSAGGQQVLRTRLPVNASIVRASMSVGGWPAPFWRDPIRVTPGTGSEGENSPEFFSAPDRLWMAWASKDPTIVDGADWDIVVSWSFDGTVWAPPVDISPPGDPYEDDSPDIIGYGGKVYVAWSAAQTDSSFAPSAIYIRSWDGTRWEDASRLTPPGMRYMNDGPQLIVYLNGLFVFWRTTDPTLSDIYDTDDMDMVFRTFDGERWSGVAELTPPSDTEIDWSLNLIEFDGRLFAFWDQDVDTSRDFTVDIFYRSFDGSRWSAPINIIPQPDRELDEIPRSAIYRNPVTGRDELWVTWIRGNPSLHDLDIMARRYDGSSWGTVMELTDPAHHNDNQGQVVLEYDHRLYVAWITGTNTSEETNSTIAIYNTYGDVVLRAYDGYRWSDRMELTPGDENDNANSPTISVYGGKLYVGWAYPYPPPPNGKETWDIIVRNIDFRPVVLEMDMGDDGISDWGPSELQSTNERIPLYGDELEKALKATTGSVDEYGNRYCDLGLRLKSIYPSAVSVSNLSIEYSLSVRFEDLSGVLNSILASAKPEGRAGDANITIPLRFSAATPGRLTIRDLNLTYIINLPPVLIDELPHAHFPEDAAAVRLLDLEEFFWDDWDDGNLLFEVTFEQDAGFIHATVEGRFITFIAPTRYWHGTQSFRVRAYDRGGLWADSNLFCVTVDHVNHAPVLAPIADQRAHVGDTVYFESRATDPDNDPLSFSVDDARFPLQALRDDPGAAFVRFVARRPGTTYLNVTVDDGNGGRDTRMVAIRVGDKTSSSSTDLCLTWLVIVALAAGGGLTVEWYRRRYLKETGPTVGPGGEYSEEQVFSGTVSALRGDADVQGGSEQETPGRISPPDKKVLTRDEMAAQKKKEAEDQIRLPEAAVQADKKAEAEEEALRTTAAGHPAGKALLPLLDAPKDNNGPARDGRPPPKGGDPPSDNNDALDALLQRIEKLNEK